MEHAVFVEEAILQACLISLSHAVFCHDDRGKGFLGDFLGNLNGFIDRITSFNNFTDKAVEQGVARGDLITGQDHLHGL